MNDRETYYKKLLEKDYNAVIIDSKLAKEYTCITCKKIIEFVLNSRDPSSRERENLFANVELNKAALKKDPRHIIIDHKNCMHECIVRVKRERMEIDGEYIYIYV